MSGWWWGFGVAVGVGGVIAFAVWRELRARARNSLGRGRLGTLRDAERAGLLDASGLYLGTLGGRRLHYNGDGHLLTYGRTGAGKGQTVILPNLALVRGRSLVVTDPKGENARAAAYHRKHGGGSRVVFLNPWGMDGLPSVKVNPLARLNKLAAAGRLDIEALELAQIVHPLPKGGAGENEWITKLGQTWIATRLLYMAHTCPDENTLPELWRFFNRSLDDYLSECETMDKAGVPGVTGAAALMASYAENNPRGFSSVIAELVVALALYSEGTRIASACERDEFDFAALKTAPHSVFLMVPGDKLVAAAPWIAVMSQHILESVARATGDVRTLFVLDEFANLPRMPIFEKALRLYRGYGVQFWPFVQGRHSLRAVYGDAIAKDIEDQADVLQMFGVEDAELLRDVEAWSGGREVLVRGASMSAGDGGERAREGENVSRQRRAVLHSEDIRTGGARSQILRVAGHHLFVADRAGWWDMADCRKVLSDAREPFNPAHLADLQS